MNTNVDTNISIVSTFRSKTERMVFTGIVGDVSSVTSGVVDAADVLLSAESTANVVDDAVVVDVAVASFFSSEYVSTLFFSHAC